MNPYVADPHWGWMIVAYFYMGGIAAGAYATYSMIAFAGDEDDCRAARVAAYIAFPLVALCGILLIVDLNRPERFWHMMIQSNTYRPMFKWWSPMSVGSWGLSAFGAFSFASFLGALAEDGRLGLGRFAPLATRLRRGWTGRLFELGGTLSGFFLGAYTGTLLTASNQPIWADTPWLSALFLASAASTGVAAMILLIRWRMPATPHVVIERLERVDRWAVGLELVMLLAFAASLGHLARPAFLQWPGALIPAFVVPAGIGVPLIARVAPGRWLRLAAPISVLLAGLALRHAMVGIPGPLRIGS